MSLQDLRTSLQDRIKDGALELGQQTTGSRELETLLSTINPQGILSLREVTLALTDTCLTIAGQGQFWNVTQASIRVEISEHGGKWVAAIHATPPPAWSLPQSFPHLPVTAGLTQSVLSTLHVLQAQFDLTDMTPDESPRLSMSIVTEAKSLPLALRQWLGETDLTLSGVIDLAADTPRLQLSAQLTDLADTGPITLADASLQLTSALDSRVSTHSALTVRVDVQVGKAIALTLTDEMNLIPGAPLRLQGKLAAALALPSLTDLLGLISADLAKDLDAAMPELGLQLAGLRLHLQPTEKTVSLLSFEINNGDRDWLIGPTDSPYLTVHDMALSLQVHWPLDATQRSLGAVIHGQSDFLQNRLRVQATFPGPVVSAALTGKPLPVLQLLTHNPLMPKDFSLSLPTATDALAIETLAVELDPQIGSLFLSGKFILGENFTLPLPGIKHALAITELGVSVRAIRHDPAAAMLALTGSTTLAGARSDFNLVYSSGTLQCAIELQHVKLSELLETCLGAPVKLPALALDKAYLTSIGSQASIGARLSGEIPIPLGATAVVMHNVWANVDLSAQSVSAQLGGEAMLGATRIVIATSLHDSTLTLAGSISRLSLPVLLSDLLHIHDGVPALEIDDIQFTLASNGEAHFSADRVQIDFVSIAEKLGLQPPVGTPNPSLSKFQADFDANGLRISLTAGDTLSFGGVSARGFTFALEHSQTRGLVVTLGFAVQDKIVLADGCELDLALTLSGVSNGEFTAAGNARLQLFTAKPIELIATLENQGAARTLCLQYRGGKIPLNQADDLIALTLKTLSLEMVKTAATTNLELTATAEFSLAGMDTLGVSMFIEAKDNKRSLGVKAETMPITMPPLSLPSFSATGRMPTINIQLHALSLSLTHDDQQTSRSGLSLSAKAGLSLSHFAPFDAFIGSELVGGLTASPGLMAIDLEIPAALQAKKWPQLTVKLAEDHVIPLPIPSLQLQRLGLNLGKTPVFSANWRITVPPELNKLIGFDLFSETFDLQLDIGNVVRLWPTGEPAWPLRALHTEKRDGQDWLKFDVLHIEIPKFEFDGNNWAVHNLGIRGLRSFGLPLAPLKFLMRQCGAAEDVIAHLPDRVALGGIDLDAGHLDQQIPKIIGSAAVSKINALLQPTGKTLDTVLKAISGEVKKLPLNLQEYFKLDIPDTAQLDIGVTSTGGCRLALRVDPAHPLRLLLPYMGLPPGILGITLREFTIGEGAAGMLMLIGCDGYIDQFDLVSLVASVAMDNGQALAQRITLNKVFALAPTPAPIPIPLFFGELAFDHVDFLGFELHSHWSFGPAQPPGLSELFELILALIPFCSKRKYYLHTPGNMPDSLKLPFTIGANNFTLPGYLGGGKPQGLPAKLPAYNMTDSIAYLLDAGKDLNPAFAIQAIPLLIEENGKRHWLRVNKLDTQLSLGPISLGADAAWCIATEEEFAGPIAQFAVIDGVLTTAALDNVFAALPNTGQVSERGFVIFIMGGWALKAIVGMQCQFGMAYTHTAGFQTGLRVSVTLAEVLRFSFGGTIQVSATHLYIEGDARLYLQTDTTQTNLLRSQGEIEIVNAAEKLFRVQVQLAIGLMSVAGKLIISDKGVSLTGALAWPGFAPAGKASVEFRSDGVVASVAGKLAQLSVRVSAQLPACQASLIVDIDVGFAQHIQQSIVKEAQQVANREIDAILSQINQAMHNLGAYSGTVGNLRKQALPKICDTISVTVTTRMHAIIQQQVEKRTPKFAPAWVKNGIVKAVSAVANRVARPYLDAVTTLRNTANQSQHDTANAARALIRQCQKPIYGITPLHGNDLNTLTQLVELVDKMNETQKIQFDGEAAFKRFPLADQIFARVRASTDKTIAGAIPQINSLQVTGIALAAAIPSTLQAAITFANAAPIAIVIYPHDLVQTAGSIASAIHRIKG